MSANFKKLTNLNYKRQTITFNRSVAIFVGLNWIFCIDDLSVLRDQNTASNRIDGCYVMNIPPELPETISLRFLSTVYVETLALLNTNDPDFPGETFYKQTPTMNRKWT